MGALKRAVCDKLFKEFIWGRVQNALHQPPHMLAAVFEPPKLLYQWSFGTDCPIFAAAHLWVQLLCLALACASDRQQASYPDAKIHRIKIWGVWRPFMLSDITGILHYVIELCHFENCIFNFTMLYLQKFCICPYEIFSTCCKISWLYILKFSSTYLKNWRSYIKNKNGTFFMNHPVDGN